ncbi:signal peptidase I [Streptomyces sp. KR80]|uniref:signal peptidase I n=1 Tax=Streptomyces sp. KR80 TaxID=3457426 RepID=UPI003FCFF2E3
MSAAGRGSGGRGGLGHVLSGLAVAVGCVLFLGGFVWGAVLYQPYTVPTDSMAPTVDAGDRVLAQRIDGGEVRRGDVVVFTDASWGDLPMVKRVVAVGGDQVSCCDRQGRLQVNGEPIEEPYLQGGRPASPSGFDASVPKGSLFLLGDNRSTSQDSRVHLTDGHEGAVARGAVSARVEATAWPPDGFGMLERATPFDALPGGISEPGPLRLLFLAIVLGAVLILGGAAHGPLARRAAREKARTGVRRG